MNQQFLIHLSEVTLFLVVCFGIIVMLAASVYDALAISRRRHLQTIIAKLRKPRQPHITVLVYASNNAATIEACLRSIQQSRYRNYDIVVVDNVSHDMTKQAMRNYKQKHPKHPVYYYGKRKQASRLQALQQGYDKSQQGDIILSIGAASTIPPTLLKEGAASFVADDSLKALRLNERSGHTQDILSVLLRFLQLSRHAYAKCSSLLSLGYIERGESSVMYKSAILKKDYHEPTIPCRYAGHLVVTTQSASSLAAALTTLPLYSQHGKLPRGKTDLPVRSLWRRAVPTLLALILIFTPLLMTYFFYTAATLQSSSLLMFSWLSVTIWFFVAVLSDESAKVSEKIELIFCLPVLYFLLYFQLTMYSFTIIARTARIFGLVATTLVQFNNNSTWLRARRA